MIPSFQVACVVVALTIVSLGSDVANAQTVDSQPGVWSLRVGPVTTTPRVVLSNFGVDSNVFNETSNPKSDTTFVLVPSATVGMRLGRGSLTSVTQAQVVYFHKYANQRSTNPSEELRVEVPLNRVTARGFFTVLKTHDRPTLEIDTRVPRFVQNYGVNGDVRFLAKTTARVEAFRSETRYSREAIVDGVSLRQRLDLSSTGLAVSARYAVSPLTTAIVRGEWSLDQFRFEPSRDAENIRVTAGLELSRFALISGSASVGFRQFKPESGDVPEYRGLIAGVALSSVIRGATRINVTAGRDISYSFSVLRPYYLQWDTSVAVTQRFGQRWEAVAMAGRQRIDYGALITGAPVVPAPPSTTDGVGITNPTAERSLSYGLGTGYHVTPAIRVGVDARRLRRSSGAASRDYESWQAASSVSYGF